MLAIILAGGEGTRLRPLTENRPKPLMPVAGRPCIEYVVRSLVKAGFKKQILTTGYRAEQIIRAIGDGGRWGASILYSFEEVPVGTAGAVKKVEGYIDDTFIVASGDVLADVNIRTLLNHHKKKKAIATMALTSVENPTQFGIVGLDKKGRIERFKEKPAAEEVFSNLINAGIYVLEPEVLDLIPKGKKFDFSKNVYPKVLKKHKGKLYGKPIKGLWMDIGRPSDLIEATFKVLNRDGRRCTVSGRRFSSPSIVEEDVLISKATKVKGPSYFGAGARVGGRCQLDTVAIYRGAVVDEAVLNSTIVLEGCTVAPGARLENCIVGAGTVVGPGRVLKDEIVPDNSKV
jgi:mannose-1-phosphate guanylyltransferase